MHTWKHAKHLFSKWKDGMPLKEMHKNNFLSLQMQMQSILYEDKTSSIPSKTNASASFNAKWKWACNNANIFVFSK